MNYRILAKILGWLLVLVGGSMGLCGVFAWLDPAVVMEGAAAGLFRSAGVTLAAGGALAFIGRGKFDRVPRREGVMVVGLGWIFATAFGSLPFHLCPPTLGWSEALFEAASGFTTTGSTVIEDLAIWPRGILLWRAMTQWLGGVGILVLFVAMLSYLGVGSKSLFRNESSFQASEASSSRIRDTAMTILKIYLAISTTCCLGLKALGLSWFNAVAHTMTAVSTGGFSPHNESIGYYSGWENGWAIELWISLIMLVCSLNFLLYVLIVSKRWQRLRDEEDGWFFVINCGLVTLAVGAGLVFAPHGSWAVSESWRETSFTVVSLASSTGFANADYARWPAWCQAMLVILMLIGGCSGSTAGGMKMGRMVVFLKSALHDIVRAFRPNLVFRLKVNGNVVDDDTRARTVSFVALYLLMIALGSVVVGMLEAGQGIDLETCLGATLGTFCNTGPGFGEVGPTQNFAHLRDSTQIFLSALMVLGRLELFAILVLFIPAAWRRY
jgi:trk system potassium uptake protein TrkH